MSVLLLLSTAFRLFFSLLFFFAIITAEDGCCETTQPHEIQSHQQVLTSHRSESRLQPSIVSSMIETTAFILARETFRPQ